MTRRNPISRHIFLHALGWIIGAMLLLAACGGSPSTGGATTGTGSTTAPAASTGGTTAPAAGTEGTTAPKIL